MTTGEAHGAQWSRGARDWASMMEPHFRPLYEAVFDRVGVGDGTRLLDVGCGPGGALLLAAERGARVAGLDASPGAIEVARERLPEGDLRVGDMATLPWHDGAFDAVTGFNSFPFAGNPAAALAEARRVLVPGGKLGPVVWAPPQQSQQPKIMAAVSALAPPLPPGAPGPFALSGPGALDAAIEAAGLQILERGDLTVTLEYPDAEAVCRSMMAGSGGMRAKEEVGEERVRQVILGMIGEFRVGSGYRFINRFLFVVAQ